MPSFTSPLTPDGVPRPPNSWILYRADKHREVREAQLKAAKEAGNGDTQVKARSQAEISQMIAEWWRNEVPETKKLYEEMAEMRKRLHLAAHPNYRYKPKRQAKATKTSAATDTITVTASSDFSSKGSSPSRAWANGGKVGSERYSPVLVSSPPKVVGATSALKSEPSDAEIHVSLHHTKPMQISNAQMHPLPRCHKESSLPEAKLKKAAVEAHRAKMPSRKSNSRKVPYHGKLFKAAPWSSEENHTQHPRFYKDSYLIGDVAPETRTVPKAPQPWWQQRPSRMDIPAKMTENYTFPSSLNQARFRTSDQGDNIVCPTAAYTYLDHSSANTVSSPSPPSTASSNSLDFHAFSFSPNLTDDNSFGTRDPVVDDVPFSHLTLQPSHFQSSTDCPANILSGDHPVHHYLATVGTHAVPQLSFIEDHRQQIFSSQESSARFQHQLPHFGDHQLQGYTVGFPTPPPLHPMQEGMAVSDSTSTPAHHNALSLPSQDPAHAHPSSMASTSTSSAQPAIVRDALTDYCHPIEKRNHHDTMEMILNGGHSFQQEHTVASPASYISASSSEERNLPCIHPSSPSSFRSSLEESLEYGPLSHLSQPHLSQPHLSQPHLPQPQLSQPQLSQP
ncbi:hypothetical protein FA10DRAFT_284355 [Acaromyces ingoldii]|uniref:HMG box domain-containing protein n=1 Tax=Acaromyces ingoldii TaxID=215250 RepID=A0A316YQB4_9BASI|nr:hypothetical protein FA10DRAFT_284355 [Acaromyces ingoldii]PWN91421.1 hypothetical protein FA10DRAFT_284355 [Acaromyces ingoldii]